MLGSAACTRRVGLLDEERELVEMRLPGELVEARRRLRPCGVGDDGGHRTERGLDLAEEVGHCVLVEDVGAERLGHAPGRPYGVDDRLSGRAARAVVHRHRPPVGSEPEGDGSTEAARGTGHDGDALMTHSFSLRAGPLA
jgi:hypothetical protein